MVYEHLRDAFGPDDSHSGYDLLYDVAQHVARGRIPHPIAHVLGASRLLALEKPSGGVRPIAVGEVFYRLVSQTLCAQLRSHFENLLSPHQYGVGVRGGCEMVVHGLRAVLDLHPDWIVFQVDIANAFNSVERSFIFFELRAAGGEISQLLPFVRAFYSCPISLLHHVHGATPTVEVLQSSTGTRQGDPLGGALFALAHFCELGSSWE